MRKIKTSALAWSRDGRYKRISLAALALVVCGGIWLRVRPERLRQGDLFVAANANRQSQGEASKEYIYAGSRLLAVEEAAAGASALPAPAGLLATGSPSHVTITWEPTPGAHHYRLERAEAMGESGPDFKLLPGDIPSNTFTDSVAATADKADKAFLYRARAADAAGNLSLPGDADLATTVVFTDDPLAGRDAAGGGTVIMAAHLNELRRAAGAVRTLAGLPPAAYTHPAPGGRAALPLGRGGSASRMIFLADVLELRAALDEALSILGRRLPYETDPQLKGGYVKAAHFRELRDRVK